MSNFKTHIYSGIFSYPLFMLIYYLIGRNIDNSFVLGMNAVSLAFIFYVIGSDLPDLDSNTALIKRSMQFILMIFFTLFFYNIINDSSIHNKIYDFVSVDYLVVFVSFTFSLILGFLVSKGLDLLNHRGFFHTFWAAAIYAFFTFSILNLNIFNSFNFDLNEFEITFITVSSFTGYSLHLIIDHFSSSFKENKFL